MPSNLRLIVSLSLAGSVIGHAQDTVRVKAGPPLWGTNVGLKQLYVLGGPPEYDFGAVYSTAVDKYDRVYVFDIVRSVMRAYDSNGKFLRTIGRAGAGPGEFRIAVGATIVQDTVLAVYDPTGLRVVYMLPDGTYLRTLNFTRSLTLQTGQLRSDHENHLYFRVLSIAAADGRSSEPLPPARQAFLRVSPDGRFVDSMPIPRVLESTEPRFNSFSPRGAMMESAAGAVVFGSPDRYRFVIRPFRGAPRVVEKTWQPTPLEGEERAQIVARAEEQASRDPKHPAFSIPRSKPAYERIFTDQDGRIWVSVFTAATKRNFPRDTSKNALPPLDWRQDPTLDVFDPTGRFLGTVVLPYASTLWAARNDRIYVASTGPEGESRLIAYQLTGIRR